MSGLRHSACVARAGVRYCPNPKCCMDLAEAKYGEVPRGHVNGVAALSGMLSGGLHATGMAFGEALRAALALGCFGRNLRLGQRLAVFVEKYRDDLAAMLSGWLERLGSLAGRLPRSFGGAFVAGARA